MNQEQFDIQLAQARQHLRDACKSLFMCLGHANGALPQFEKITHAAVAALQVLAHTDLRWAEWIPLQGAAEDILVATEIRILKLENLRRIPGYYDLYLRLCGVSSAAWWVKQADQHPCWLKEPENEKVADPAMPPDSAVPDRPKHRTRKSKN
jgi:hypothetical protein